MKEIVIATNNQEKVREIKKILELNNTNLLTLKESNIDLDVEENYLTLELNAIKKAKEYYSFCKKPVIAEDSGLFVEALDGLPGVFSKRWLDGSDYDRNKGILENMSHLEKTHERMAYLTSCFTYYDGVNLITATGNCGGHIDFVISGENGFAYDKIFIHCTGKKLSHMTEEEKNNISQRKNALLKLKDKLSTVL